MVPPMARPRSADNEEIRIDPRRTLDLLNELQKLRFNDEAFWRLHHFRQRKKPKKATIASFRAYCEKTSAFLVDGTNERVHRRLAFVLENFSKPYSRKSFVDLAEAAFDKIPPVRAILTR